MVYCDCAEHFVSYIVNYTDWFQSLVLYWCRVLWLCKAFCVLHCQLYWLISVFGKLLFVCFSWCNLSIPSCSWSVAFFIGRGEDCHLETIGFGPGKKLIETLSSGRPAKCQALWNQCLDWLAWCQYTATWWGRKFDLQLLCQCGSMWNCLYPWNILNVLLGRGQPRNKHVYHAYSLQTEQRPRNNTDGSSGGGSGVVGATVALDQQQQQLQDKLKDLQQKKRHMDQLLAQLETLRSQRLTVMNNGKEFEYSYWLCLLVWR